MLKDKKLFLFDIDGTIAVGDTLFDGSKDLLEYIEKIGGKAYYITNNSTKSGRAYVEKFNRWDLKTEEGQFITSGYVSILYLKKHFMGQKIFVLGTGSFIDELRKYGLTITEEPEPGIACVLTAFDNELTYKKLEKACEVLTRENITYLATNPDLRCPAPFGFIPDCGAICHMIEDTVGRTPKYLGKPERTMVDMCIEETGFTKEETLVVGDRLYTDIACGINGEVETCVVFTGEAKEADLADTEFKPDYAFDNVRVLLEHCHRDF